MTAFLSALTITEGHIREIQKHFVTAVRRGSAQPDQFRTVQNYVVNSAAGQTIYTPPPPADVPPRMDQLVDWLNASSEIHSLLIAGVQERTLREQGGRWRIPLPAALPAPRVAPFAESPQRPPFRPSAAPFLSPRPEGQSPPRKVQGAPAHADSVGLTLALTQRIW